jgi:1,4-alpha-glucan branching enzyme
MEKTSPRKKSNKRRVTFSLFTPTAHEVSLGGDFNDWDAIAYPMKKDANGLWKKTLVLAPARYEYKFMVDGRWQNDPNNEQLCPDGFGTQNNVITIS